MRDDPPEGKARILANAATSSERLPLPYFAAFDAFVAQPRYFGEMTEWLKVRGMLADQDQTDHKCYLQTMLRWLRHFLPGRYRLDEPNYSELFGRVEGWEVS